jgi:hypothetical protein
VAVETVAGIAIASAASRLLVHPRGIIGRARRKRSARQPNRPGFCGEPWARYSRGRERLRLAGILRFGRNATRFGGRDFNGGDRQGSPLVAIINQAPAAYYSHIRTPLAAHYCYRSREAESSKSWA